MDPKNVKPEAGQVWRYMGHERDDAVLVRHRPLDAEWWDSFVLSTRLHGGVLPGSRVFLRWATAAECAAAGVPYIPRDADGNPTPAPVDAGPEPTQAMCDEARAVWDSSPAPSHPLAKWCARKVAEAVSAAEQRAYKAEAVAEGLRIGVAAAEREVAVYRREFNVGDLRHEIAGLKRRAGSAERARDEATKRAEAAEAKVADLTKTAFNPQAGDVVAFKHPEHWAPNLPAVRGQIIAHVTGRVRDCITIQRMDGGANTYGSGQQFHTDHFRAASALEAKPAPALCVDELRLTREDRAWMDAAQRRDAHYDGSPLCRDTAKAAIAARTGNGVVGA